MQALGEWPTMAVVVIADVVEQALPRAHGEVCIPFSHCSHEVKVVRDSLHPGLYECTALVLAGSPQFLLNT